MLLSPKRVKYRKMQRGRRRGAANKGNKLSYGEYGLQALESGWVTNTQIEAARVAISRNMKVGKVYIRTFPDKPITRKPAETRMGKGKGAVDAWVAVVKRGKMMFETEGLPGEIAKESLRRAAAKISLRTRFVSRKDML